MEVNVDLNEEDTSCEHERISVADFIEDLDVYYSNLPNVNLEADSSLVDQFSQATSQRSGENSYALPSFSLGDVDSFLREDTNSVQTGSMNTTEDDDIATELMNLNTLEKKLAKELEIVENTPTPERTR